MEVRGEFGHRALDTSDAGRGHRAHHPGTHPAYDESFRRLIEEAWRTAFQPTCAPHVKHPRPERERSVQLVRQCRPGLPEAGSWRARSQWLRHAPAVSEDATSATTAAEPQPAAPVAVAPADAAPITAPPCGSTSPLAPNQGLRGRSEALPVSLFIAHTSPTRRCEPSEYIFQTCRSHMRLTQSPCCCRAVLLCRHQAPRPARMPGLMDISRRQDRR